MHVLGPPLYAPDQSESTHAHRLQIGVSAHQLVRLSSVYCCLRSQPGIRVPCAPGLVATNLLVISKVVPKICARTNSAMVTVLMRTSGGRLGG